jgi:crotonobetainyl-CoA:carnitine CoA-transferase CaiB-like acyl-CoA transferase
VEFGESTAAILKEIGYSEDDVKRLADKKVV